MPFQTFEKLPVFKLAHIQVLTIYKESNKFPKSEMYGLTNQIRRAVASIPANIVEGLHRNSKKELIQFLYQARASCAETIYHLILARDLKYLKHDKFQIIRRQAEDVMRQLNGWIRSEKINLKTR